MANASPVLTLLRKLMLEMGQLDELGNLRCASGALVLVLVCLLWHEWLRYVVIYVINLMQNIYNFLVKHHQQYLYVAMALAAATKDCMGHGEFMSVNSLWCCWAVSLGLAWMLSHLSCGLFFAQKSKTETDGETAKNSMSISTESYPFC